MMETNSFRTTLDMILDESKQYYSMISETYYINEVSLADKIRKFDLKKILSFILKKFIDVIKAIWDQFKAAYHALMFKSSLLKKYRKQLENISWDVKIDEERSIFTNLDSSSNISMYKMALNDEYSTLIHNIEKMINPDMIINIKDNLEPLESYLDQQRGVSISSSSSISKDAYAKAVFEYFCPAKEINDILTASEIREMTKEYFESKTLEKSITKDESILRSSAQSIILRINEAEKLFRNELSKAALDNNELGFAVIDIIRLSCDKVQGLCNIYLQLFSIKLDVFKMYKHQQIKVLSKVIIQSMREGKM